MNFYDAFAPVDDYWYTSCLDAGQCCAVTEAILDQAGVHNRVEKCIRHAIGQKRTLLFWHVLPHGRKFYKKAEEEILCLPATIFIGEYRNKRSGKLIRSYVTNLQQEW